MIDELELKTKCVMLGKLLAENLPEGVGFTLLLFGFTPDQFMTYMSNAKREDMVNVLEEFKTVLMKHKDN